MTYIGMVIDQSVHNLWPEPFLNKFADYDFVGKEMAYLEKRVKALKTWPGQRIADDLICKVC